jgi:hypothetical protein
MGDVLVSGQEIVIPSTTFNFLKVVNDSPFSLEVVAMHNDIVCPIIIIRDAAQKGDVEGDKAIKERLKSLEGVEAGN